MKITLKRYTADPESAIAEAARISHGGEFESIEKDRELIGKLLKWGHESPMEFADATFLVEGISRTCSHQLVRHRLCSFLQRSGRYCESEEEFVNPFDEKTDPVPWKMMQEAFINAANAYRWMMDEFYVKKEDARFILPQAECTSLFIKANFREWRNLLRLRCAKDAQWEIRAVADNILRQLAGIAPSVFIDIVDRFLDETSKEIFHNQITNKE